MWKSLANSTEYYIGRNHWQFGILKKIRTTGENADKVSIDPPLQHVYNARFGITLSTCSLTWQNITTLTFANSITFEDTFLVRGPLKQGNNLWCYFRIDIHDYDFTCIYVT